MINVKWLQAFRAVVRAGTVTEAADVLCVTQPAVSRMIGHLEADLGFPLFTRRGGRLSITPQGESFYQEVERALADLDSIEQKGRNIRQGAGNYLRIFAMSPLISDVMPRAMARLLEEYPTARASIDIRGRRDIEQWIPSNQFDIGFVLLPVDRLARKSGRLASAPVSVVMAPDNPLALRRSITLETLAQESLIMLPKASLLRRWIDGKFAEIGLAPPVRIEASTISSGCLLSAEGLGVTIADALTIHSLRQRDVAVRPIEPTLNVTFGYVLPSERQATPIVRRLIEIVRDVAETMLADIDSAGAREVRRASG